MRRYRFPLFFPPLLVLTTSAFGQPQATPARPETARQALIEIVTKGGDALFKHLTVEVQDALKANKKFNSAGMSMLGSMKPDGVQAFEAGEVLFALNEAAPHTKYEVHVDSDDLNGGEDSLLLSLHEFHDEKEQDLDWGMSPHFTVSMKFEQNVWRLNTISVGAEFPVGDPEFMEKTLLKSATSEASGLSDVAVVAPEGSVHANFRTEEEASPAMAPERVVQTLAYAESMFARQHPEVGFTCNFSELAESSKMMGVDQQVNNGAYNGYRFALAGCEGKPAGSYQITAEPLAGRAGKAFCTDATQNLRSSEDGRGAACLASGRVQDISGEASMVGIHFEKVESKPKQ